MLFFKFVSIFLRIVFIYLIDLYIVWFYFYESNILGLEIWNRGFCSLFICMREEVRGMVFIIKKECLYFSFLVFNILSF